MPPTPETAQEQLSEKKELAILFFKLDGRPYFKIVGKELENLFVQIDRSDIDETLKATIKKHLKEAQLSLADWFNGASEEFEWHLPKITVFSNNLHERSKYLSAVSRIVQREVHDMVVYDLINGTEVVPESGLTTMSEFGKDSRPGDTSNMPKSTRVILHVQINMDDENKAHSGLAQILVLEENLPISLN